MNNLQYLVPFSPQVSCFRSNYQRCSVKKDVLRNFAIFTGKYLCQGLYFNKVADACNFVKKEALTQVFPVNFAKFLRTSFSQNTSGRLLLVFGGMLERQQGKPFIHRL